MTTEGMTWNERNAMNLAYAAEIAEKTKDRPTRIQSGVEVPITYSGTY